MLQYCVLYAKIQKLNMSNVMNKTNSAGEVDEEGDLAVQEGQEGSACPARAAPSHTAQRGNYNCHPSDNGGSTAHNGNW